MCGSFFTLPKIAFKHLECIAKHYTEMILFNILKFNLHWKKCICEVFIYTKKHNINCAVEMLSLTATECLDYKLEDN